VISFLFKSSSLHIMAVSCLLLISTAVGCGVTVPANPNIAFMGDSITAYWSLPSTNLGVPGQHSSAMLSRFSSQVLSHNFRAVVILAGSNDIRGLNVPIESVVNDTVNNIRQMAILAEQSHILVVLCAIPPIWLGTQDISFRVEPLNLAIKELAQARGYRFVDYFTPMQGHRGYFRDGLHPNEEGYAVMERALYAVIPSSY
jgi:lysophospholipase L1-like esterase